jgi:radical SAM family uncharacterized protein/radical SAM-linked protein
MNEFKSKIYDRIEQEFLPFVEKPLRYSGTERNIIRKSHTKKLKVLLAFPEVYEMGMSFQGFNILYNILNKMENIVCERVYVPEINAGNLLREREIPVFSLESRTPINEFDVIGITLPYELNYTNILELFDLGNIPFHAEERDLNLPLIIGGGANSINPEPIADFFDIFQIGDGEEKFPELLNKIIELKGVCSDGEKERISKKDLLRELSRIESVYIPAFFTPEYENGNGKLIKNIPEYADYTKVKKATTTLELENYPLKPLVPQVEISHDRIALEVMRGCCRGCRFCQAGFYYRPIRERSVEDILQHANTALCNSGFNELTLLSLSTSDYSGLDKMLGKLYEKYLNSNIRLSFPSIRAETFTEEMAEAAQLSNRKASFTFAPEAGSDRLRSIINKPITFETIKRVLDIILPRGWQTIKFYFMIGLPFENDDDIHEMANMINKIGKIIRGYKKVNIHVSISPFNPKPHTPFQWAPQATIDEFRHKIGILIDNVEKKNIKLNWRNPEISVLEAIFARGDRRLSKTIVKAFENGAKFDGWSEHFNSNLWMRVFDECGTDLKYYLGERKVDDIFPWDMVKIGVSKDYLLSEWNNARELAYTKDCRNGCNLCGLEKDYNCRSLLTEKSGEEDKNAFRKIIQEHKPERDKHFDKETNKPIPVKNSSLKYRIKFKRLPTSRFMSQRDMIRYLERGINRENIIVDYSKGYHPIPLLSFGHPLSFGFSSKCEFVDITLKEKYKGNVMEDMKNLFSDVLEFCECKIFPVSHNKKFYPLMVFINYNIYKTEISDEDLDFFNERIEQFKRAESLCVKRKNKKGKIKELDLKNFIEVMHIKGNTLFIGIKYNDDQTVRMTEVFNAIFDISGNDYYKYFIEKTESGKLTPEGNVISPMDGI